MFSKLSNSLFFGILIWIVAYKCMDKGGFPSSTACGSSRMQKTALMFAARILHRQHCTKRCKCTSCLQMKRWKEMPNIINEFAVPPKLIFLYSPSQAMIKDCHWIWTGVSARRQTTPHPTQFAIMKWFLLIFLPSLNQTRSLSSLPVFLDEGDYARCRNFLYLSSFCRYRCHIFIWDLVKFLVAVLVLMLVVVLFCFG